MTALYDALIGRDVQFRLRDVHLPDVAVILEQLHGEDVLHGMVAEITERSVDGGVFLVIHVEGLLQPVLLAAERVIERPPAGRTFE